MTVKSTKYHNEVHSHDINGKWIVRLHKDGTQLKIESGTGDEVYINVDEKELSAIIDLLNKGIKKLYLNHEQ